MAPEQMEDAEKEGESREEQRPGVEQVGDGSGVGVDPDTVYQNHPGSQRHKDERYAVDPGSTLGKHRRRVTRGLKWHVSCWAKYTRVRKILLVDWYSVG